MCGWDGWWGGDGGRWGGVDGRGRGEGFENCRQETYNFGNVRDDLSRRDTGVPLKYFLHRWWDIGNLLRVPLVDIFSAS